MTSRKAVVLVVLALTALTTLATPSPAQNAAASSAAGADEALVGSWMGTTKNDERAFFIISRRWNGGLKASFGVIESLASGNWMDSVALAGDKVTITGPEGRISFEGVFSPNRRKITGRLKLIRRQAPITLEKVASIPGPSRPQTPRGPFPYEEREVHYRNDAAGITLAGTLTLPREGGPFPAVLLVPGSGASDRDEEAMFHKPFAVIADYLTRRGIAVLRADKRGVGESEGDWTTADVNVLAGDALAGLEFLAGLPEIDAKRMGVLGQSEGGMVGPAAAAMSPRVSFVVALAGPAMKWLDCIALQDAAIALANGATQAQAGLIVPWSTRFYETALNTPDKAKARKLLSDMKARRTPAEREAYGFVPDAGTLDVDTVLQDGILGNFRLNPGETLARVQCPVLALFGEKDCQVPSKANLESAERAFAASGNKDATALELPSLNHCFQRCTTGAEGEYGDITETISPDALKLIGDWLASHAKPQAAALQ